MRIAAGHRVPGILRTVRSADGLIPDRAGPKALQPHSTHRGERAGPGPKGLELSLGRCKAPRPGPVALFASGRRLIMCRSRKRGVIRWPPIRSTRQSLKGAVRFRQYREGNSRLAGSLQPSASAPAENATGVNAVAYRQMSSQCATLAFRARVSSIRRWTSWVSQKRAASMPTPGTSRFFGSL